MKRIHIASALGAALLSTAALAASGDAWYGTNRVYTDGVAGVEITRTAPTIVYEERVMGAPVIATPVIVEGPVIVERGYVVMEPQPSLIDKTNERDLFYVTPEINSRIDKGLFNRKGPNDFGS